MAACATSISTSRQVRRRIAPSVSSSIGEQIRGRDSDAAVVVAEELATVERIRAKLARHGWWN